jgi:PKD repeat protein
MIWNNLLKTGFSGILFIFIVLTRIGLAQALIVDNTDADFSVVGTWPSSSFITGFYGTDYLYAESGDGSGTATWTFDISSSGEYDIYGIWTEHSNRAPDAPYSIYNNGELENTILVNQQVTGGQFSLLGRFSLEPGTLEVVLSDYAAGYVVADAIKLEAVDPTPVAGFSGSPTSGSVPLTVSFTDESTGGIDSWSWDFDGDGVEDSAVRNPSYEYGSSGNYTVTLTVSGPGGSDDETKTDYITVKEPGALVIVDNSDVDFTSVGNWYSSNSISGFYGTDYLYAESGDGSGTAAWTFDITSSGEYYIYAMWTEHSNRAPDAPYSAYNNGQLLDTVSVDQRSDGGQFNLLGNYQLESGTVYIRLTDDVSPGFIVADAVMLNDQECNFSIMSPNDLDLLVSQEVEIRVSRSGFPEDWHAEIVFDGDFTNPILAGNCDPPSGNEVCAYLSDVSLGEHTVDAYMVDGSNSSQPFSDHVGFGIGDYYVAIGDSITHGSHDDISADNTSQDGRNSGGGYEPILNNHMTITREYAHTVINEGVSGDSSADGIILLPSLLSEHPNSEYYLVQYGTNDAWDPVPSGLGLHPGDSGYPGTFKDNMQQIIDQIRADGKEPFLAKVPIAYEPYSYLNDDLNKYNQVIDELIGENNIPDFYALFENNPDQIADGLHPNGTGYQSMAQEWHDVLVTAF